MTEKTADIYVYIDKYLDELTLDYYRIYKEKLEDGEIDPDCTDIIIEDDLDIDTSKVLYEDGSMDEINGYILRIIEKKLNALIEKNHD